MGGYKTLTRIGKYVYEIDSNNIIRAWHDDFLYEGNEPNLFQDVHPTGRAWSNRQEAEDWIIVSIERWSQPSVEEPTE